jgi:hypothetical protein
MISVVCVYNNERILKDALLKSLQNQTSKHELILIDNTQGKFESAAGALNWGGDKAKGEYIMFVHQDVDLCSDSWLENVEELLNSIPALGIAGVAGARSSNPPRMVQSVTNIKQGMLPKPLNVPGAVPLQKPEKVQTVDECLVIIPRPVFDMLQFDEEVCDDWHLLYAVDYSLSVARLGLDAYAIPAFIHHWSPGKFNRNFLQVILSAGFFPAGYYRILGKLLKKHRSHTERVYGTTGCWSTSYPLTLVRAKEVLRAVLYAPFWGVLWILGTIGIVSRPRNAYKRFLSAVKHLADSDAQNLD